MLTRSDCLHVVQGIQDVAESELAGRVQRPQWRHAQQRQVPARFSHKKEQRTPPRNVCRSEVFHCDTTETKSEQESIALVSEVVHNHCSMRASLSLLHFGHSPSENNVRDVNRVIKGELQSARYARHGGVRFIQ